MREASQAEGVSEARKPTALELHREAMELAEDGLCRRKAGELEMARDSFQRALDLELGAIDALDDSAMKSRAILTESAFYLARDANKSDLATELALSMVIDETAPQHVRCHFQRLLAK